MKTFKGNGWTISTNNDSVTLTVHNIHKLREFAKFNSNIRLESFLRSNKNADISMLLSNAENFNEFVYSGINWKAIINGFSIKIFKLKSEKELLSLNLISDDKKIIILKIKSYLSNNPNKRSKTVIKEIVKLSSI